MIFCVFILISYTCQYLKIILYVINEMGFVKPFVVVILVSQRKQDMNLIMPSRSKRVVITN